MQNKEETEIKEETEEWIEGELERKEKIEEEILIEELLEEVYELDHDLTEDQIVKGILKRFKGNKGKENLLIEELDKQLKHYNKRLIKKWAKEIRKEKEENKENKSKPKKKKGFIETLEINHLGEKTLQWNGNEANIVKYYKDRQIKKILNVGISLNTVYETVDEKRFYDIEIGNENIVKPKNEIIDFIENERNYAYVSGPILKNTISIILRKEFVEKGLNVKEMIPTIGVFTNENNDLIVSYPGIEDLKLYGVNDYQKKTIDLCKRRGIDKEGEITQNVFNIFKLQTIPKNVRLISLGHSSISAFFHVLKGIISVYPNFFWIAEPNTVGKTTHLKICYNFLFGTEIKNLDDVESMARFTKACTSHTPALHIDDIDVLPDKVMSYIKTSSTKKKARERMNKDQSLDTEETYTGFVGSANSDKFLFGEENEAFRSRCIIAHEFNDFTEKDTGDFKSNMKKIQRGPVFGYYLLSKSIEYIDETTKNEDLSSKEKLEELYEKREEEIKTLTESEGIYLSDRRLDIYTLIYIGWELWDYTFESKDLELDYLKDALNYDENDLFIKMIKRYEKNLKKISYQEIQNIIQFYEYHRERYKYRNTENKVVLTTNFINDYDKWARKRGYDSIKHLTTLAEMLTKILREKVKVGTKKVRDIEKTTKNSTCNNPEYGIVFDIKKIKQNLGMKTKKDIRKEQEKEKERKKIIDAISGFFEVNGVKSLPYSSVVQFTALELEESKETIKKTIEYLEKKGKVEKIQEDEKEKRLKIIDIQEGKIDEKISELPDYNRKIFSIIFAKIKEDPYQEIPREVMEGHLTEEKGFKEENVKTNIDTLLGRNILYLDKQENLKLKENKGVRNK